MENKKRNITGLTFLIMGVIVLIIGIIAMKNTDMSKYDITDTGERRSTVEEYKAEDVKELKLILGASSYTIKADSTTDKITVDSVDTEENYASTSQKDGVFEYRVNNKELIDTGWFRFHFFDFDLTKLANVRSWKDLKSIADPDDGKVIITVPDKVFDKVTIECGVGNSKISGIKCRELIFDGGVGNVELNDVTADKTSLDAGVGNLSGYGSSFGKFELDAGVGNINLTGAMNDADINCGVGNVSIHVLGNISNYDVDSDDADIHGSGSGSVNSGERYKITVDSGLGDCNIYFE